MLHGGTLSLYVQGWEVTWLQSSLKRRTILWVLFFKTNRKAFGLDMFRPMDQTRLCGQMVQMQRIPTGALNHHLEILLLNNVLDICLALMNGSLCPVDAWRKPLFAQTCHAGTAKLVLLEHILPHSKQTPHLHAFCAQKENFKLGQGWAGSLIAFNVKEVRTRWNLVQLLPKIVLQTVTFQTPLIVHGVALIHTLLFWVHTQSDVWEFQQTH